MIKVTEYSNQDLVKLRNKLDLSQTEFWNAVNVTQSSGSRYETDRKAPDQILLLVELIHERKLDLSTPTKRLKLSSK